MPKGQKKRGLSRRQFLILGGQIAAALAWPGGAAHGRPPGAADKAAGKGGTLRYAHLGEFVGFDAHRLHAVSFPMFNLLYNPLIRLDKNMNPRPELAESWRFSDANRTLTLRLRRGVKFHSGRALTSEDVKANLLRMQNPAGAANARPLAQLVERIETPERQTVVLRLGQVVPNIFDLLDLAFIMDPESFSTLASRAVGTGPFRMQGWRLGEPTRFTRFAEYYKPGLPLLDEVIVQVPPDPTAMVVGIEEGKIDVIERFLPADASRLKKTRGIQVVDVFAGFISDLLINTQVKPFDDSRVRRALDFALNRQLMIQAAQAGIGEPWCLPFPKNSLAYHGDLAAGCRYDLKESSRLLKEAGLGDGFSFELLISESVLPASPTQAEILRDDLAKIGVEAKIVNVESAEYFQRHTTGKYEAALHQFRGANRDPHSLFLSTIPWFARKNFSNFQSDHYARLIDEAGKTSRVEKRRSLYKEIGRVIAAEAFVLCIGPAPSLFAFRERVKGLDWSVEGHPLFEQVTLT